MSTKFQYLKANLMHYFLSIANISYVTIIIIKALNHLVWNSDAVEQKSPC